MSKSVIERKSPAEWDARELELRGEPINVLAALAVQLERDAEWSKSEGPLRKMTNALDAAMKRNATIAMLAGLLSNAHADLRDLRATLVGLRSEVGRWRARALLSEKNEEETSRQIADLQRRLIEGQTPKAASPVALVGPHAARTA